MNKTNTSGFAATELLVALAVVVIIGVVGGVVYRQDHKTKATPTSSQTNTKTSTQTKSSKSTNSKTRADAYAGWKSYCDTKYHYCFKYPIDWSLDQGNVLNPSGTVQVSYQNPDTRDGGLLNFTPSYTGKLSAANQDLSVAGGYYTTGGNYSPTYVVVDSSTLTTYPLTVGQQRAFPGNASFTDQGSQSQGQLVATPAVSISNAAAAQTWLDSTDAKTSLQILQSFYYEQ